MQHPQMKKAKKNLSRRGLILLLVILAVLLAALALLLPKLLPRQTGKLYPDPVAVLPYETLQENPPEELDTITVSHLSGESYTLHYREGELLLMLDGKLTDINDSLSAAMLEAATTIVVENVVTKDSSEVADHLADMGLEPPQAEVTVRYTDGRTQTLQLGTSVPHTTYSYFRWSEDEGIYMCNEGIADIFSYTARRLLPIAQPSLNAGLTDSLTIQNRSGTLKVSLRRDDSGNSTGQLLEPFPYPMDTDAAAAMYTSLENFRLGTPLGDAAEQAQALGFDAPLCTLDIHQSEGLYTRITDEGELVVENAPAQQVRFVFGREEGEYFYTCAYEGQAYLVSRFLVENLITARPDGLLTARPADLGVFPAQIAAETEDGSVLVTLRQELRLQENGEPELNEDEEWIYDTYATLNGSQLPAAQAETLVQRLCALSFAGSVPEGWSPEGAAPRWKLALTAPDGTQRTLTAYRLDAFSDAVAVDGVIRHYCYVEALATALGEMMPK